MEEEKKEMILKIAFLMESDPVPNKNLSGYYRESLSTIKFGRRHHATLLRRAASLPEPMVHAMGYMTKTLMNKGIIIVPVAKFLSDARPDYLIEKVSLLHLERAILNHTPDIPDWSSDKRKYIVQNAQRYMLKGLDMHIHEYADWFAYSFYKKALIHERHEKRYNVSPELSQLQIDPLILSVNSLAGANEIYPLVKEFHKGVLFAEKRSHLAALIAAGYYMRGVRGTPQETMIKETMNGGLHFYDALKKTIMCYLLAKTRYKDDL